jgi:hypothetical protein
LYAARAGGIDVFNSSFQPVNNGAFATPAAISARNLVPFNVQTLNNGDVAVTYAPNGRPAQIAATPGEGAVAIFDGTGTTVKQTILGNAANAPLASPWGITFWVRSSVGLVSLVERFHLRHSSRPARLPRPRNDIVSRQINVGVAIQYRAGCAI